MHTASNVCFRNFKVLIVHSMQDELVDTRHSELFVECLKKKGFRVEFSSSFRDTHDAILNNVDLYDAIHSFIRRN